MKRVIFSLYDDVEISSDTHNQFSRFQIKEYWDRLIENKKEYASSIGVEFKLFHNTMDNFNVSSDSDFTKVNLYKHHMFAKLAEEYDEVMYCDMDVLFNTDKNIFEELDLSKGIHIRDQDFDIISKDIKGLPYSAIGKRNATLKYHITKDLLDGGDCHVMNTGIMIGKAEHIRKIKYIERVEPAIKRIEEIKSDNVENDFSYLRLFYYPNNESLFSYVMEKYNVPYVLMDKEWHYIADHKPSSFDLDDINIIHLVNKKFNTVFNDKTKCIFSIYIEIPDERLDNPVGPHDDDVPKSKRTKERLANYKDQLDKNHRDYAIACGAEYLHFERDEQYEEFFKQYPDLSEYDVINLYKVWLLDKLSKEYDLALYVDYDVYFVEKHDVFNYLPGEYSLCCDISTATESGVNPNAPGYFTNYNVDFRNPQSKYWNAHALLQEEDIDGDNNVFNTGIMMASKAVMDKINYFGDIQEVLETMKELKEFSMYPPKVAAQFGYDNETIMAYKTKINEVPVTDLDEMWHYKHDYNVFNSYIKGSKEFNAAKHELNINIKTKNIQFIHFISKNFGLIFEK